MSLRKVKEKFENEQIDAAVLPEIDRNLGVNVKCEWRNEAMKGKRERITEMNEQSEGMKEYKSKQLLERKGR